MVERQMCVSSLDTFEKLYREIDGLNVHFPDGNTPFQIITRLCDEAGELAAQVNQIEDQGEKRQRHGAPNKMVLATEIKDVIRSAMNVAWYYGVEHELSTAIDTDYQKLKEQGYIQEEGYLQDATE